MKLGTSEMGLVQFRGENGEFAWGSPHQHRGAGIRKLGQDLFECCAGIRLRLLFQPHPTEREVVFFEVGNHDEIRRALKSY